MNFLLHYHSPQLRRSRHQIRTLYDAVSSLQCPRDRGLDHAVERDKHLKPILNLKNLIISEPSKSIPLSIVADSKETLGIPFRPIDFIRKYPSIFHEFHLGSLKIHPHVKLSPEIVCLSSEEDLLHQSVNYKQDIAGRLLKLLMISRVNKIPILLLERLRWELGLPEDYERVIIPDFPDYFRVIIDNEKMLELVCWSNEFAVPEIEKKRAKDGKIEFPFHFSKDFEMDKKYKKWVDEWQKLPYISPYENASHLASKSDESDKWSVGVLHEVLNLFVGKRVERESLLSLGEYLGLRSRFKMAVLQHPGIFYVSSKIGMRTVVLKEAYKRGMMLTRHPLMDMRSKYIKLMNVQKGEERVKGGEKIKSGKQKSGVDVNKSEEGDAEDDDEDEEMYNSSDEDEDNDQMENLQNEIGTRRGRFERNDAKFGGRNGRRTRGRMDEDNVSKNSSKANVDSEEDDDELSELSDDQVKNGYEGRNTRSMTRRHGASSQGGDSNFHTRNTRNSDVNRYRTNGTGSREENGFKNSSRRRNFEGGNRDFPTRTGYKTDFSGDGGRIRSGSYVNNDHMKNFGTKKGILKRKGAGFEERNAGRRSNRKLDEGNAFESSPRFPGRAGRKSGFSGNQDRSKTRNTRMH